MDPTAGEIEAALAAMDDPGDFIRLHDAALGEVRATGPFRGTYLLQCDLPFPRGMFAGETSGRSRGEAAALLKRFRAGEGQLLREFQDRQPPLPRSVKLVALLVVLVIAYAFLKAAEHG